MGLSGGEPSPEGTGRSWHWPKWKQQRQQRQQRPPPPRPASAPAAAPPEPGWGPTSGCGDTHRAAAVPSPGASPSLAREAYPSAPPLKCSPLHRRSSLSGPPSPAWLQSLRGNDEERPPAPRPTATPLPHVLRGRASTDRHAESAGRAVQRAQPPWPRCTHSQMPARTVPVRRLRLLNTRAKRSGDPGSRNSPSTCEGRSGAG